MRKPSPSFSFRKCILNPISNYRYIAWITDDKLAWQLNVAGMGTDTTAEISARPVPQEPMVRSLTLASSLS